MNTPLSRPQSEQIYFNAKVYSDRPLSRQTVERYQYCRHPHTSAEAAYVALGDLRGASVLEIGCGDGRNSIMMTLLGANVTAIDLSSRAIAAARARARNQGVSVRFHEMSVEEFLARTHGVTYDVICGWAILHHILPVLRQTMQQLQVLSHTQTRWMFVEPMAFSASLRRLRLALPLAVRGTPDERPLNQGDLAVIESVIGHIRVQMFDLLLRFYIRLIGNPPARLHWFLARMDAALLRIPALHGIASVGIITSSKRSRRELVDQVVEERFE